MARPTNVVWVPVTSSNLHRVCWYKDTATGQECLDIEFHKGGVVTSTYHYQNVPQRVFRDLLAAPSKGKYHDQHIKWHYFYTPI